MPAGVSATATAHVFSGAEPYPIHAREAENDGKSCNTCHFPESFTIPDIDTPELGKPAGKGKDRAIYLVAEVVNKAGKTVASKDWMFAPWFGNRPDDRKYLEEDKKSPHAVALMQADAQGPHEDIVRAGEERVLPWTPKLKPGRYTVKARLVFDLNRYNDRSFTEDQTEINSTSLAFSVK